jgi:hypothetical protein
MMDSRGRRSEMAPRTRMPAARRVPAGRGGALGTKDLRGRPAARCGGNVARSGRTARGGDMRPPLALKNVQKRRRSQVRNGLSNNIAFASGPRSGILRQPKGVLSTAQPRI